MERVNGSIYEFEAMPRFGNRVQRPSRTAVARARAGRAVPLVGIIRNPRSHRNKGKAAEMADCSNILTETPRDRKALLDTLGEFARRGIDYLVIDGGDGTVRDVLTCGTEIFGEDWPRLIVLPKGKTNALTVDLGLPGEWSLTEALAAAHKGKTVTRHPLRITSADAADTGLAAVQGFILGSGVYTLCTEAGQEAHRRGAFNSLAVGISILSGILQALFGREANTWRRGTPTRLIDRMTGRALPHAGAKRGSGETDRRFLTIATTFERFPLGMRPFGRKVAPGLKLLVLDRASRLVLGLAPLVMMGLGGRLLGRHGLHRFATSDVDMDIEGPFILDGEAFPAGRYIMDEGPQLTFVVP